MTTDVMTRPAPKAKKRSPEREALASAVEVRNAAAERLRAATDALAECETRFYDTRSRYYEADDGLTKAKDDLKEALRLHGGDEAAAIAAALKAGDLPPREAVKKAEDAYQTAKEAYDLGKEGKDRFKGAEMAAAEKTTWAERKANEAASRVCETVLVQLADRAERARREHLEANAVLAHVAGQYDGVTLNINLSTDPVAKRIRSILSAVDFNTANEISKGATEPWRAAHEALLKDPDAPLPEI